MPEEKRTFESDTISVGTLNIHQKLEVEAKIPPEVQPPSEGDFSFSKEMVRRLIAWLEEM